MKCAALTTSRPYTGFSRNPSHAPMLARLGGESWTPSFWPLGLVEIREDTCEVWGLDFARLLRSDERVRPQRNSMKRAICSNFTALEHTQS